MPRLVVPARRGFFLLAVLSAAAPFFFGLLRAIRTGSDLRLLWIALASAVGATVARAAGRAGRKRRSLLADAAITLVVATAFAGAAATLQGATAAAGIWGVAFVFGSCWAVSHASDRLARQQ